MKPVIRFENVSKHYYLGSRRAYAQYLLPSFLQRPVESHQTQTNGNSSSPGELWALKDVSFEVNPGEALGLVGPNGAGKTTALSILAGITNPTKGKVEVQGRVSALIRLGAGFHYELTGRENIYLNSTILGLKKREIDAIVDEIIDFSELEQFIDTPIKRYSSGMFVRLGFAVAAHIQPEILLIDEVLAVGDAAFKAKCFQKVRDLRENGTTVILVSHDMAQIKNIADRALLLKGSVLESGDVDQVVKLYYQIATEKGQSPNSYPDPETLSKGKAEYQTPIKITSVNFLNEGGVPTDTFATGDTLRVAVGYHANQVITQPAFGVSIHASDGTHLTGANTKISNYPIESIEGSGVIEFAIPHLALLPGTYLVGVVIHDQYMGSYDRRDHAYKLNITDGPITAGVFYSPHTWELKVGEQLNGT